MQVKMPRVGFLVAACFGAVAIVLGASGIYSGLLPETKDYDSHFSYVSPVIALLIGIALIVLAFRSEIPGRSQRLTIGIRNLLIALLAVAVALILFLIYIGPLR